MNQTETSSFFISMFEKKLYTFVVQMVPLEPKHITDALQFVFIPDYALIEIALVITQ